MKLSISIVNWNTKDFLFQCLNSIYSETSGIDFEIFVVDNASSDGSAEMVGEKFPKVKLIENDKNLGFGRANNQALRHCSGEYILILNPDTRILDNAIIKLIQFMEKNPRVGMTGPKCVHEDGTIQVSWAQFPTIFNILTNNVPWKMAFSMFGIFKRLFRTDAVYSNNGYTVEETIPAQRVDYVLGQFMLTRKAILDEVGLFDEDVFMYEEERDLCYRIQEKGWETWFVPDAVIVHHERRSIDQLPNTFKHETDWLLTGRAHYYEKNFGKFKKYSFHVVTCTSSFLKLILFSIALLFEVRKRAYLKKKLNFHWWIEMWYFKHALPFLFKGNDSSA
ncbi:MAG: glycosyltransferase family 2 protein [bacterium]